MKTFSQRKGLKPVSEIIQTESMNSELRNSLWNALDIAIWSRADYMYRQHRRSDFELFSESLWFHYFKEPIDSRPNNTSKILAAVRAHFFACAWFEVYDFLEFVVNHHDQFKPRLAEYWNGIFERELSAYRFVLGHITDITSTQEIEMLELTLADSRFAGVTGHLQRALELYANREKRDYRNSIKESISAVESIAQIISENPKASLSDALKAIDKKGSLHPALKEGFIKLYAYTSDADGIRHAMQDKPNLSAADAQYFLLSCTSFVNYLKAQIK